MTQFAEKLSAFLDGELPEDQARQIEKALETDTDLQAELESLMAADTFAKQEFAAMENEPVPFDLASAIQNAPQSVVANAPQAPSGISGLLAAMVVVLALCLGAAGGYLTARSQGQDIAAAPGWLSDIADYHRVYAAQERHLVEVPAAEKDHIQTWLSATLGAQVQVPDLSAHGLEFQGARLLVAAGKPVSQLMYLDANQRVVALCQIVTPAPRDGFATQTIGAFEMVSWGGENANFVIVGDQDRSDLSAIAQTAATQV